MCLVDELEPRRIDNRTVKKMYLRRVYIPERNIYASTPAISVRNSPASIIRIFASRARLLIFVTAAPSKERVTQVWFRMTTPHAACTQKQIVAIPPA